MANLDTQVKKLISNIDIFTSQGSGLTLRSYQRNPVNAVLNSVINKLGLSFVVIFPRQSGKNEIQAQIQAYLLTIFSQSAAEIVVVSPTWKPQSENAMYRLETALSNNLISRHLWSKQRGFIYTCHQSRAYFLSGSPTSNIVGITANTLLCIDEAQDIQIDKFDKDILPMAASTNATRVFFGTAWTSNTLLSREERSAAALQKIDGLQRVWRLSCDDVGREVPSYKTFVADQVGKLGRNHPMVKTQYFSEDIDAEGGLFPPDRLQSLLGSHPPLSGPLPGRCYVATLDVAGEDEAGLGIFDSPSRDSTALTIAQVDLSSLSDPSVNLPTYKIVHRYSWTGVKHPSLFSKLLDLFSFWSIKYVVCDATGVGAGLVSFLSKALGSKVIPFVFTQKSKSDLAWSFLALVDSQRIQDYVCFPDQNNDLYDIQKLYLTQLRHTMYAISTGPDKRISWGVPENTRDLETGNLVHDDLLISAALFSLLDNQSWAISGPFEIVSAPDPLDTMEDF
jgi:hypothetical protein